MFKGQNIRPVFISQQIFIIRRQKMYMPRQFATSPADVMNIPCLFLPLFGYQFRTMEGTACFASETDSPDHQMKSCKTAGEWLRK